MSSSLSSLSSSRASCLPARPAARRTSRCRRWQLCCQASQQQPLRRLILMRHADSEPPGRVRDHDREVSPEGASAARQAAEQLRALGWLPEVVICSNAKRTRQTLDVLSEVIPELADADAHFLGSLYTTAALDGQTRGHLSEVVAAEAAVAHQCCLCLGHNKGWEEAASSFAGQAVRLGNSHAALLEGRGATWGEALQEGASWRLVEVLKPQ